MPKLQQTTKSNNGIFIYNNGNSTFIKQPNIVDVARLYQAIVANIKMVHSVFNVSHKHVTK